MNALLILLLCSVTYCFAYPTCTSYMYEMRNCGRSPNVVDTEEKLEISCEVMSCGIGVGERCGMKKEKFYLIFKRTYEAVCVKSNPIREKFVRNIKCLNDVIQSDEFKQQNRFDREYLPHDEYCRKVNKFLEFLYDRVLQRCGRDAKDAVEAAYPDAEFFGCP